MTGHYRAYPVHGHKMCIRDRYKISLVEQQFPPEDNASRVRFLNGVTSVLAAIEDPLERDMYINWVSREYEISAEPLKEQISVLRAGGQLNAQNIFMKRPVATRGGAKEIDEEQNKKKGLTAVSYTHL